MRDARDRAIQLVQGDSASARLLIAMTLVAVVLGLIAAT